MSNPRKIQRESRQASLIQEVLVLRDTFTIEIDGKVQVLLGQSTLLDIVGNAREIKLEGNTTTRKSFKNCLRLRPSSSPSLSCSAKNRSKIW
jgi:hypothetical protein